MQSGCSIQQYRMSLHNFLQYSRVLFPSFDSLQLLCSTQDVV
uniref:Uncharacterized protein n=1 Tax=Utricularia reniformis TaxID=192314 RepID=A0A1Y0B177_9LAMI|nr:hypothetical protein AEK19_MT0877 [Utricularia reniformis]ART31109.1 hypothetical protein AEK19_MT0877 [Utricularia reniformis]